MSAGSGNGPRSAAALGAAGFCSLARDFRGGLGHAAARHLLAPQHSSCKLHAAPAERFAICESIERSSASSMTSSSEVGSRPPCRHIVTRGPDRERARTPPVSARHTNRTAARHTSREFHQHRNVASPGKDAQSSLGSWTWSGKPVQSLIEYRLKPLY